MFGIPATARRSRDGVLALVRLTAKLEIGSVGYPETARSNRQGTVCIGGCMFVNGVLTFLFVCFIYVIMFFIIFITVLFYEDG